MAPTAALLLLPNPNHHRLLRQPLNLRPPVLPRPQQRDSIKCHRLLCHVRPLGAAASPVAVAPGDHWGNWAFLLSAAAFGTWSEEKTRWGGALSGALVSIIAGLAATSCGLVSPGAPAHDAVMEYLLPAAVPLLLLGADLRRVVRATGDLFKAFLIGSVATVIGTTVAYALFPMRSLGQDSWKIAAALMGSYIGGAVNYVAISEALGVSPSALAAGVAADNLITALYFMALFSLASKIPPEPSSKATPDQGTSPSADRLSVLNGGAAIALSFVICKAGSAMANRLGFRQGGALPCVTALAVFLPTAFPIHLGRLAPAGEVMAGILMQVFFTVVGANGNLVDAVVKAPSVFAFALVQVTVHLAIVLGAGSLMELERKHLLLASNANVGGRTTAASSLASSGSPLPRFLASDSACSC